MSLNFFKNNTEIARWIRSKDTGIERFYYLDEQAHSNNQLIYSIFHVGTINLERELSSRDQLCLENFSNHLQLIKNEILIKNNQNKRR